MRHSRLFILPAVFLLACVGDAVTPTPTVDAGNDVTAVDASTDMGTSDVGVDAGPNLTGAFDKILVLPDTTLLFDVAVAPNGDIIVVGQFRGSNVNIGGFGYTSVGGNYDIIVMRLAPNFGVKWAKAFGAASGSDDSAHSVTVDAQGDAYITGSWHAPAAGTVIDFGNSKTLSSLHAGSSSYLIKLDPAGITQWATTFDNATSLATSCNAITHDVTAKLAIACSAMSGVTFTTTGGGTASYTKLNGSITAYFLAELDDAKGEVSWSTYLTGTASLGQAPSALAYSKQNDLYVAGSLTSSSLSSQTGPAITVVKKGASNASDGIVLKLGPGSGSGRTLTWANVYGVGSTSTAMGKVAVAADDTLFVSGSFNGTRDFGKGDVTAAGTSDAFALHLDKDGKALAVSTYGDLGNVVQASILTIDPMGNVPWTARYQGTGWKLGTTPLPGTTPNGNSGGLYAKLSPALGTPLYAHALIAKPVDAGNPSGVQINAIAAESNGAALIVGWSSGDVNFGDGQFVTRNGGGFILRRSP